MPCNTQSSKKERIMNKIAVATAVALVVGAGVGLALSSVGNPKLVVSCEGNSCSVQVPGVMLDEVNKTMAKTLADTTRSEDVDEQALLKEVNKLFDGTASEHDATEDSDAVLAQKFEKLFH
jgi:hypothetical protein